MGTSFGICRNYTDLQDIKKAPIVRGFSLNQSCSLQGFEGAVFGDGPQCLGRNSYPHRLVEFRDENLLILKINVALNFSDRVKFSRTSAV